MKRCLSCQNRSLDFFFLKRPYLKLVLSNYQSDVFYVIAVNFGVLWCDEAKHLESK